MSRRRAAIKRKILPDAKYGNYTVAKFMNCMMFQGKKSVAETILYGSFDHIKSKTERDAIELFMEAIENVKPSVEVRSRRVGGATYQVPVEIRSERSLALSIRWLIKSARSRSEQTMIKRLASEFLDASNNRGSSIKRRDDTYKMAEANKAFAHFRW